MLVCKNYKMTTAAINKLMIYFVGEGIKKQILKTKKTKETKKNNNMSIK
jgi:hypothetical protein